jgi:hypothetical protein
MILIDVVQMGLCSAHPLLDCTVQFIPVHLSEMQPSPIPSPALTAPALARQPSPKPQPSHEGFSGQHSQAVPAARHGHRLAGCQGCLAGCVVCDEGGTVDKPVA